MDGRTTSKKWKKTWVKKMSEWISVKKKLPPEDSFVKVKFCILFSVEKEALYCKKYFISRGENITRWVQYWRESE